MPIPITSTISGSRSGSVLGQNEYSTQVDVWLDIMFDIDPEWVMKNYPTYERFEGNASTDFGSAFESSTIQLTEQKTGLKIIDQERVFEKQIYPQMNNLKNPMLMSCHVDGIFSLENWKRDHPDIVNPFPGGILYEGKTTFEMAFRKKWDVEKNLIPRYINLQCQHNCYLADLQEAIVSVLVFPKHPNDWEEMGWYIDEPDINDGQDGYFLLQSEHNDYPVDPLEWAMALDQMGYHHIFKIERNDDLIKTMLEKYQEFWTEYVIPKKPPTAMNFDDIKKLCPSPHGTVVLDQDKDKNIISWINEIRGINKEIGTAGLMPKRKKELTTTVMNYVKDMPAVLEEENTNKLEIKDGQGFTIATYSKQKDEKRVFRVSK